MDVQPKSRKTLPDHLHKVCVISGALVSNSHNGKISMASMFWFLAVKCMILFTMITRSELKELTDPGNNENTFAPSILAVTITVSTIMQIISNMLHHSRRKHPSTIDREQPNSSGNPGSRGPGANIFRMRLSVEADTTQLAAALRTPPGGDAVTRTPWMFGYRLDRHLLPLFSAVAIALSILVLRYLGMSWSFAYAGWNTPLDKAKIILEAVPYVHSVLLASYTAALVSDWASKLKSCTDFARLCENQHAAGSRTDGSNKSSNLESKLLTLVSSLKRVFKAQELGSKFISAVVTIVMLEETICLVVEGYMLTFYAASLFGKRTDAGEDPALTDAVGGPPVWRFVCGAISYALPCVFCVTVTNLAGQRWRDEVIRLRLTLANSAMESKLRNWMTRSDNDTEVNELSILYRWIQEQSQSITLGDFCSLGKPLLLTIATGSLGYVIIMAEFQS